MCFGSKNRLVESFIFKSDLQSADSRGVLRVRWGDREDTLKKGRCPQRSPSVNGNGRRRRSYQNPDKDGVGWGDLVGGGGRGGFSLKVDIRFFSLSAGC